MLVIPAIDLRSGRTVRLLQGDFNRETVYSDDPVSVARRWISGGATLVHVVDLDGAQAGRPIQGETIRRIAAVAPVQVGGGLRTLQDVEDTLRSGARRVVLGTAALDPSLVREVVARHGGSLVVALDTRSGTVAVQGWTEESGRALLDVARELVDLGVPRFLHTDVERDGALTSPNFASLESLVALGVPVIASGGVASLDHIRRLRDLGAEAVIVGRALYEGTIDLKEAMAVAGEADRPLPGREGRPGGEGDQL
jgi:phosphoribosylformimino-5-aminoimidazole carboxamide ribotide isomerase